MLFNSLLFSPKSIPFSLKTTIRGPEGVAIFNKPDDSQRYLSCSKQLQSDAGHRHFVLVHGACHGAWCWYKVSALLKSAGHSVTALDMAASGVHPKQIHELRSFLDYFEPLMEFMASLPPEERVVLVGHSLGGVGLSVAMEKFPEKISAGVFAAATMAGPDFDFKTIAQKYPKESISPMDSKYIYGDGPNNPPTATILGPKFLASKYYRFSPPENLVLATLLVRPSPLFSDPEAAHNEIIFTKERYGSVYRVYIVCDQENDVVQKLMIENNPPDEVKVIPGSDHMVMFSKPHDLCSCLMEIGDKCHST
ncbi:hypothetical protein P3X46_012439 [Hevea brasiliensis]|uniref:AB hydrolase-1 domain-containing protein n=1 Tax=Hevea brasiliensis TaxID=3981 RepID=A0ABQ9MCX3_HEVBR|nr:methyl jasmonate esterase 1 isoform X1 [Hevea brasiliensis]KAJ9177200.1 hypothetical protein P3X46_012439 [Hevea brasiliensis]